MSNMADTAPGAVAARPGVGERFCSKVSAAAGDDPAGTGASFDTYLTIEVPLPWNSAVMESPRFPSDLAKAVAAYQGAAEPGRARFAAMVPEAADRHPGQVRVLVWRRPDKPFATFHKREFLLPEREVAPFVEALPDDPDGLVRFGLYEQDTRQIRDIRLSPLPGAAGHLGRRRAPRVASEPHRRSPVRADADRHAGRADLGTSQQRARRARSPANGNHR